MVITIGNPAPDFTLLDDAGNQRSLSDFKGKKVALYFYPKDGTPGCTTQACGLRDNYADLKKAGIEIIGISYDSVKSHAKFKQNNQLPFILLSDADKTVAKKYQVDRFLNLFPHRTTFLINESGIVVGIIDNVDVQNHAQQILRDFGPSKQ